MNQTRNRVNQTRNRVNQTKNQVNQTRNQLMMVSRTTVDIDISSYTHMVVVLHTVRVIVIHYVMLIWSRHCVLYCNSIDFYNSDNSQEMYPFFTLHSP